ncbi:purine-binding chemotaxis protein [Treponema pallidum subsp. pallidum str. Sea 81-4]|nr:purine-binding chemotaxis protein [Treponema pallidum subsp. pallidum str. Sea 81-4]
MAVNDEQFQLVTFQLGEELYGIDIMGVKEIVKVQDVRPIPCAPAYVEGIFNLRSEIIPIINLHKRFHLREATLESGDEYLGGFVILNVEDSKLGIIIDRIARVIAVSQEDVQSPSPGYHRHRGGVHSWGRAPGDELSYCSGYPQAV